MSHMVIYRTADGQPGYHQTEALEDAVSYVERLRNGDGVDHARIFRMEEVAFDFKPYFRVEVGGEAATAAAPAPAPQAPPMAAPAAAPLMAPFSSPAPASPVAGGPSEGGGWMDLPLMDDAAASEPPLAEPFSAPESFSPHELAAESPVFGEPEPVAPVFETIPPPPPPPPALDDEAVSTSNGMGARRGLFGR